MASARISPDLSTFRVKRTLAIKLGALGDVALALPFLQRLWAGASQNSSVVTTLPFVPLIELTGQIQLVTLPRRSWLATVQAGLRLRREGFERIVDLQGNRASRCLAWLAGPRAERAGLWPGWPYHISPQIPRYPLVHAETRNAELARILNLPKAAQGLKVPEKLETRVGLWLESRKLSGKRLVLMHAGCSQAWATKRWPPAHFIQTARALADKGCQVLWLGTREEASLNRELSGHIGTDATDQFGLAELIALGGRASFAVTNDSGPMHVLAAAGLPVYALFGPIDPNRSHALGQGGRVIHRQLPCQPCYSKTCLLPGQTHDCLAGLGPEAVLSRLHADGWI